MIAEEVMQQSVVSVTEETALLDVARVMLERRSGYVLVVDRDSKLRGIITDTDFTAKERGIPFSTFRGPQLFHQWLTGGDLEEIYREARTMTAQEIMSSPVVAVGEKTSMERVVILMMERHIYYVPVLRSGQPVGIIARHDLLRIMVDKLTAE